MSRYTIYYVNYLNVLFLTVARAVLLLLEMPCFSCAYFYDRRIHAHPSMPYPWNDSNAGSIALEKAPWSGKVQNPILY